MYDFFFTFNPSLRPKNVHVLLGESALLFSSRLLSLCGSIFKGKN